MALFAFVLFIVMLILIGVGIAVGLVACAIAAVLLGIGVFSSSVFVGLRSGRATAGIRAFLLQCGLFAGLPAGAVCAWLVQSIFEGHAGDWRILVYGALGGACVGLVLGYWCDLISRKLHEWASVRFLATRSEPIQEVGRGTGRFGINRRTR